MYLDYDRRGFDYPIVPFAINCYGRKVHRPARRACRCSTAMIAEADLDPPAPTPRRLFDLGAATARALAESPYRVALLASSGWSHAFLTAKNHFLYPDTPADRRMYEALCGCDWETWRGYSGGAGRGQRPAGDPELDVPRRRAERARAQAAGDGLRRHLDLQFVQGVPDRAAALIAQERQMKLKDRVALVTGTSPNIGGGIAEGLAAEGAAIVAVDASAANAKDCAAYISRQRRPRTRASPATSPTKAR